MKIRIITLIIAIGFLVALSPHAYAVPILPGSQSTLGTWVASDSERSAKAVFSITGDMLQIELTNLATLTDENDQLLMGLFFGFTGTLTNPNVVLSSGSSIEADGVSILNDPIPSTLNGEFGYLTGINDDNGGRGDYGICSSGLDPNKPVDPSETWEGFGVNTIIDDTQQFYTKPANPEAPNGPDFGITGPNGWGGSNALAYIKNSVVITWAGAFGGLDLGNIDQVHFLYGTDYDNVPIPEPSTMLLLGAGLIGLAAFGRKKVRNS